MDGHLRRLVISGDLFAQMFGERPDGHWVRFEGLPADAEFVRLDYDPTYHQYTALFRHPSFPAVAPGEYVPALQFSVRAMDLRQPPDILTAIEDARREAFRADMAADMAAIRAGRSMRFKPDPASITARPLSPDGPKDVDFVTDCDRPTVVGG